MMLKDAEGDDKFHSLCINFSSLKNGDVPNELSGHASSELILLK